jgi:hypothetical protein
MSSTCFEPESSSSGRRLYIQLWYGSLYTHLYKQSSTLKNVFETRRKYKQIKRLNIDLENPCFIVL